MTSEPKLVGHRWRRIPIWGVYGALIMIGFSFAPNWRPTANLGKHPFPDGVDPARAFLLVGFVVVGLVVGGVVGFVVTLFRSSDTLGPHYLGPEQDRHARGLCSVAGILLLASMVLVYALTSEVRLGLVEATIWLTLALVPGWAMKFRHLIFAYAVIVAVVLQVLGSSHLSALLYAAIAFFYFGIVLRRHAPSSDTNTVPRLSPTLASGPNEYGPDPLEPTPPAGPATGINRPASSSGRPISGNGPSSVLPTTTVQPPRQDIGSGFHHEAPAGGAHGGVATDAPGIGAGFMGYCPGCRKLRSSLVRQCILCGNAEPVPSPPPPSEVDDKYAFLLKYSDKARAMEARLSKFPDDLRKRFKQEAVSYPDRIEEIADAIIAEHNRRQRPFSDPKLDVLYQRLEPHGPEAQSEFRRVLEFLKGQVDPEKVFAQISEEHSAKRVMGYGGRRQDTKQPTSTERAQAARAQEKHRLVAEDERDSEALRRTRQERYRSPDVEQPYPAEAVQEQARSEKLHRDNDPDNSRLDPKVEALYQKLSPLGPQAQAEFLRVIGPLRDQANLQKALEVIALEHVAGMTPGKAATVLYPVDPKLAALFWPSRSTSERAAAIAAIERETAEKLGL